MFEITFAIGRLAKQLASLSLAILKLWIVTMVAFLSPKLAQELFKVEKEETDEPTFQES